MWLGNTALAYFTFQDPNCSTHPPTHTLIQVLHSGLWNVSVSRCRPKRLGTFPLSPSDPCSRAHDSIWTHTL